jgi:serine/threonine-protein kinase RsbW
VTQVASDSSATTDQGADVVLLAVPASGAWLGVLRTATASLASRLQFTLDEIEDLRIAVDEACALLLHRGSPDGTVTADPADDTTISCVFTVEDDALTVDISGPRVTLPDPSAFAWAVLDALVDSLRTGEDIRQDFGPTTWFRLSVRSGPGSWS